MDDTTARISLIDVEDQRLPLALAQLHHRMTVGTSFRLTFTTAPHAQRQEMSLPDIVQGAGFKGGVDKTTTEQIVMQITRERTLPDVVGPEMQLLICGLNPSVYAADAGVGFARPGNRFWPAALAAELVTRDRNAFDALTTHHVGMTDLVKRATPRADALTKSDYAAGAARVERLTRWLQPGAVCFVGLAGWRATVDRAAVAGKQPVTFGDRPAYVMPNTSGINARVSIDELTDHFRAALALANQSAR